MVTSGLSKPRINVVLTNNGCIEIIFFGDQTRETMRQAIDNFEVVKRRYQDEGKPIHVLCNTLNIGSLSIEALNEAMYSFFKFKHDKIATLGDDDRTKKYTMAIIKLLGQQKKSRYFTSREEALEWLHC